MIDAIYSYHPHSSGAKALAQGLGVKRIKHEGSRFRPNGKTVVNWGGSDLPQFLEDATILNPPQAVAKASNKLTFFNTFGLVDELPPFTADKGVATEWCRKGKIVVCRTKLQGHSGEGIVLAMTEDELVDAPLYVQYVKKKEEFRLHFFRGEMFDAQRKARRIEEENPNWQIRNHANGFIYQRNDIELPAGMVEVAAKIFNGTGLDFGAVDTIYNAHDERSYVLEINTAPGLTGTTLEKYVEILK